MALDPFVGELVAGAILIAASVGAHLYVAYVIAPPKAVERLKTWVRSDDGASAIGGAAKAHVLPHVRAEVEAATARLNTSELRAQLSSEIQGIELGPGLERFLRSEPGVGWAREMAELVTAQISSKLGSEDAAAQRSSMSAAEKLLMGSVDFGNPIANGVWAMAPADAKRRIVRMVYRTFRSAMSNGIGGAGGILEGEFRDEPAALPAGDDGGWGDTFK